MAVRRQRWIRAVLAFAVCGAGSLCAGAQEIRLDGGGVVQSADVRRQHVELQTQSVTVRKGVADWIELRFLVAPGLHINSHTPHDELLLPTEFEADGDGPKLEAQEYPAGIPLRLEIGSGETLSTYQGEFGVRLKIVSNGPQALTGVLRYQACDAHACFPPRKLPVRVTLNSR